MRRRMAMLGLAVVLAATGCTGAGEDNDASAAGGGGGGDGGGSVAAPQAESATDRDDTLGRAVVTDRDMIYTASMTVRVEDVAAAGRAASALVVGAGGMVASETATAEQSSTTYRVPPARLDATLSGFARLGKELDRERGAEDVTDQVVDVDSRLATQRASVARVRALLAEADTLAEIVAIEGELTKREAAMESLQARADALAEQVELATVTLNLVDEGTPAAEEDDTGFLAGLRGGWDAFTGSVAAALMVLGAVLPFLIVVLPLAVVALVVRRRHTPA